MKQSEINIINDMAFKLNSALPWDIDYELAPLFLLSIVVERLTKLEEAIHHKGGE